MSRLLRTLALILVTLVATAADESARADATEGAAFVIAPSDELAADAGALDAALGGDAQLDAETDAAIDDAAIDAEPAFDTASEPPLRREISLSAANVDEPTGSVLTRRQWLYVLIGAAISLLLLIAVPTRT